jgi:uncharacterized protein
MSDYGRFIWYELMTPDTAGAKAFYSKVLLWDCDDSAMPGYTIVGPGAGVGGIMELTDDAKARGVPPNWTGYVAVDAVDADAEKARRLGGSVMLEPTDIPGIGRFAVIGDTAGAAIAIMTPAPMDGERPRPEPGSEGTTGWHELMGAAPDQDFGFYADLFGWTKSEAMDMGPEMGTYQTFNSPDGQVGGMMKKPANMPMAGWVYYFRTGQIDDAAKRVTDAGGQVIMGPMEVPGGDWVLQGMDPQGALFALMGRK